MRLNIFNVLDRLATLEETIPGLRKRVQGNVAAKVGEAIGKAHEGLDAASEGVEGGLAQAGAALDEGVAAISSAAAGAKSTITRAEVQVLQHVINQAAVGSDSLKRRVQELLDAPGGGIAAEPMLIRPDGDPGDHTEELYNSVESTLAEATGDGEESRFEVEANGVFDAATRDAFVEAAKIGPDDTILVVSDASPDVQVIDPDTE